ncbi:MAG: hypothetical protein LBU32_09680 [Clostridiales bacterium]|jgi:high-affinity Fe2+/Pb2+ permease|nr:hypothetical protein [Clostridiales bacterium]
MSKNGRLKYLYLIPILLMIWFSLFFMKLNQTISDALVNDNLLEQMREVDIMAAQMEEFIDNDWEEKNQEYRSNLVMSIDKMNGAYTAFRGLYDEDFNEVTHNEIQIMDSIDFKVAVSMSSSGYFKLEKNEDSSMSEDMFVYFRWVPEESAYENRYLAVVGVTRESAQLKLTNWIFAGELLLIIATSVLNAILIYFICKFSSMCKAASEKGGE